ncbi:hypothetical protein GUJ93_ZPchr0012g19841 [Zizania palustris]|uniref:Uncharacterized protein n=1 Tax=Zizania palustris TaxID=103762 RepID=A0A8J6BTR1_ZIZPA|nr:hypothetical protein GUJ93_ZPchr0012g19841 [Zizania palustris]
MPVCIQQGFFVGEGEDVTFDVCSGKTTAFPAKNLGRHSVQEMQNHTIIRSRCNGQVGLVEISAPYI